MLILLTCYLFYSLYFYKPLSKIFKFDVFDIDLSEIKINK